MILKKINDNTFKIVIDKDSYDAIKEWYGDDLSIYNEELVDFLEETASEMGCYIPDVVSTYDEFSLVRFKPKKKGKKAQAIFVKRKIDIQEFAIAFNDLESCVKFSSCFDASLNASLFKLDNKFYLYFSEGFEERYDYLISEFLGEVVYDQITIMKIKKSGECLISEDAINKLGLMVS